MAGASDKARFFLEQSIPELQELQKIKIFTKDEIRNIAKKRSDFEHKLNARGSKPTDYARYLEYEMNLESLRKKRAKRMGSKAKRYYAGQRRMAFIMERATRKFPGDLSLWIQYFELARQQESHKKASEILTTMLRLHPNRPELWTFAAKYSSEDQGDMTEARSYMQRGLRFCKSSRQLWLDYGKLELIYIAKIAARREILGLDEERKYNEVDEGDDPDADVLVLPTITAEDIDPSLQKISEADKGVLNALNNTPALTGAIPIAIFDAAMDHFQDVDLGGQFFDMAAGLSGLPCSQRISNHFADHLSARAPTNPVTVDALIRLPLVGIEVTSAEFPRTLGPVLAKLKDSMEAHPSLELAIKSSDWIVSYLEQEIDENIRTVLNMILLRTVNQYKELAEQTGISSEADTVRLLKRVRTANAPAIEADLGKWAVQMWPSSESIQLVVTENAGAVTIA